MSGNPFEVKVDAIMQESEVLQRIMEAMREIRQHEALIGIPQEANETHKDEAGTSISNADLLYIHTYGSPVNKIPARDVLDASMKNSLAEIAEQLEPVLSKASQGDKDGAVAALKRAGVFAEGKAKAWFTDPSNGWCPNSPITIEGGWMKNKKTGKPVYIEGKGSSKPLVDNGELRKSITSVLRRKGKAIE